MRGPTRTKVKKDQFQGQNNLILSIFYEKTGQFEYGRKIQKFQPQLHAIFFLEKKFEKI